MANKVSIVDLIGTLDNKIENNEMLAQKFNDYLDVLFKQFGVNAAKVAIKDYIVKSGSKCKNGEWKGKSVADLSVMPRSNIVINEYSNGDNFETNIYTLEHGTLLYGSIRPYFRKCGFTVGVNYVTGTIHSFKPKKESLYYWLLAVIQSEDFHNSCVIKSQGTKMPVITWDGFTSIEIPISDEKSIIKFNSLIIPLYEKAAQGIIENRKLKELKNQYLKKFFG